MCGLVSFRLSALGFGGTERVFLSVADYLSQTYGYQIDFVIDNIRHHETEGIALSKGYRVIGLGVSRTWKSIIPFRSYLKENKPMIVFSAYTETNAAAILSRIMANNDIPLIVTEHASIDDHWKNRSTLRKLILESMVRFVYRGADHILCVSKGLMSQIGRRISHRSISYIHNPVRFAARGRSKEQVRRELGIETDVKMLLAVGRICRQKNYMTLLQSLQSAQIFASNKVRLFIVGGVYEADEKQRIDTYIDENKMIEGIQFVDFTHDVQSYYEAADIFVLSSAWEGFGNVLVEALAVGLPIVSSNCNHGPAEILEDGKYGHLVPVGDAVAMGDAIRLVMQDNRFPPEQQMNRAQMFSEAVAGEAYHALIKEFERTQS